MARLGIDDPLPRCGGLPGCRSLLACAISGGKLTPNAWSPPDHGPVAGRRHNVDVLVCWRLDRLGRSLKHVTLLDELQALGVAFVSLAEGIDATTPTGKLQMHVLAAISEFERARMAERVAAGLARARTNGTRLGRPKKRISESVLAPVRGFPIREAARRLGVSRSTAHRWLTARRS